MQNVRELYERIHQQVAPVMENLDQAQMEAAVLAICGAKRIFVAGMGRTGYMMRALAMRLMQLGVKVLVLTGHTDSALGRTADLAVAIPLNEETCKDTTGAIRVRETGNHGDTMLLGSKSELCTMLTGEMLVMMTFQQLGVSQADMLRRHACFE